MHILPWLLISCLIPAINAFYPWPDAKLEPEKAKSRRFYVWDDNKDAGTDGSEIPTISIKKGGQDRRHLHARANNFPVVFSSTPTMDDSMAIHQDGKDFSYFSTLKFGSSGKEMYMLVDTGAANTWVMSSDCASSACGKHNTFGKDDSTDLDIGTHKWSITYGTGTVSGIVANDTISFAGFSHEFGFGLASTASDDFSKYPMDGILGLGRAASNQLGVPTVMQTLDNAGLLKAKLFGVHLQRSADGTTDGAISFGAVDETKFTGSLSYTKSVSTNSLWEVPLDDAAVDGELAGLKGRTAILDTGTSYILMPPGDAKAIHMLIPGAEQDADADWKVPCSSTIPVQIKFSGKLYAISHKDYVGKADADGKLCLSNIIGHQPFGAEEWLLGDTFLKNVYTVFDFEKDRIGLGTLSPDGSPQSPSSSTDSESDSKNPASSSASPKDTLLPATASATASSSTGSSSPSSSASPSGVSNPNPDPAREGLGSSANVVQLDPTSAILACSLGILFSSLITG